MIDYSKYEPLIPYMDEDSKRKLADSIMNSTTPDYSRAQLASWSLAASRRRRMDTLYWKDIKTKCKI